MQGNDPSKEKGGSNGTWMKVAVDLAQDILNLRNEICVASPNIDGTRLTR